MLPTLSSVAKDGLAIEKKTTRNSRVMNGAMLLSRLRSQIIVRDDLGGIVLSDAAVWALIAFPLIGSFDVRGCCWPVQQLRGDTRIKSGYDGLKENFNFRHTRT